jgi:hypothetical protein
LLQTKDTPITRVVGLLKNMQETISKEQDEDESIFDKVKCWCNSNSWEKGNQVEASKAKISELESDIKQGTARSAELNQQIKELNAGVAADKQALAEATALRQKQLSEYHGGETDSIQAIENLKAALTVLSKHQGGAAYGQGEDTFGKTSDSWSGLLQTHRHGKQEPDWTDAHESEHQEEALDEFMSKNGFATGAAARSVDDTKAATAGHFLQQKSDASASAAVDAADANAAFSAQETAVVRKALKSAAAFVQAHHTDMYVPSYNAQSGEIVGVLKQLKEEMEGDLSESQKTELERKENFEELRNAKSSEIASGERMSEQKEDELANTDNNLAEAKEDLAQENALLSEAEKFLANMDVTCAEADKNYEARKMARAEETKAVSETIEILTEDSARDTMSSTYAFLQVSSAQQDQRRVVAEKLRKVAAATNDPQMALLASAVELDAFGKVKKAIDSMISILKTQQGDEVKKGDWCKAEIQENEMSTAKTEDHKSDLEAKEATLNSDITALQQRINDARGEIDQLRVNMQRASEDRKLENQEFQKTVADQTITVEVLKKALDKLATYYDSADFLQQKRQTPPAPEANYKPSAGAEGVMQMIEKLVGEAQTMTKDARKQEAEGQAAYESFIKDTNDAVALLQKEVVTKTKHKGQAIKDASQAEADIIDAVKELEGLHKFNGEMHEECDYLLKNFDVRQEGRSQEIEALQQAKQILSGASAFVQTTSGKH